jgi:di/tricarboxylate transporter
MSDATITFAVLIAIVALFIWGRFPVELVAVASALVLVATGVLTIDQGLAGFGDQVVIFIAALFVVSEGLDSSGVTAWAGQLLIDRAGSSRNRLVVLMMVMVAVLTAFVTVNAAVAALLPVVIVIAVRLGIPASKLLIPLCFGAHAGSQLALTGSNVNLLVSNALLDTTGSAFGFFEFALVGVPLTVGTIAVVTLLGDRLLPVRTPKTVSTDLSDHARTLAQSYGLPSDPATRGPIGRYEGLIEIVIPPRSPFLGEHVVKGMRTEDGHLVVDAIQRGGRDIGDREVELQVGDALVLSGPWAHRHDRPARQRHRAAGRRRPPGRRRTDRAARRRHGAGIPIHHVDHGRARRWHASAVDRHDRVRCRRSDRGQPDRRRRRHGPDRPAHRSVPRDRHLRPAHQ